MKIVTLTAPSSAGKDKILNKVLLENSNLDSIISTTSRPMRKGEKQDCEYHFVNKEEVRDLLRFDKFVESRVYFTELDEWIYGITKEEIHKNNLDKIVIIDYHGLKQLREYCKYNNIEVISFYIDCNLQDRLKRALSREGQMSDKQCLEVCRRMIDDSDKVVPSKYDNNVTVLKNETVEDFYNAIKTISGVL